MKNLLSIISLLSLATYLSISFTACEKTEPIPVVADSIQVAFNFDHGVGSEALELDTIKYTNLAGNEYSVVRLKYFISDITLHKVGGGSVFIDDAHYVDVRETSTLTFSPTMKIPNGDYSSISFVFGLDTVKNVSNAFLNAPESGMAWPEPMGGGYHYMKLEGNYNNSGTPTAYNTHTGGLMGNPYHVNVTLASSTFTANGTNLTATIKMDINQWYQNPNTYDFFVYGAAIMGNMSAQTAIQQNGASVFTLSSIQ